MSEAVCSKQDTLRLLAETARLRHENERLRGELEKISKDDGASYDNRYVRIARQALAGEAQ